MNKNEYLWDVLNIDKNFNYNDIDNAYIKLKDKNEGTKFAWKVLRDEYYSAVYKKYLDIDTLIKAGFFVDELEIEDMDYYNLDFLTTPVGKILDNIKAKGAQNPVVLLTTGGFYPLHNGHLHMMEAARAPYMLPYVSLKSRANVKASNEMRFSIALWEMNKKIYSGIDKNIKLSQADCGFKRLMNYIGFKDDTLLTHICDWHIKNLKCEKNTPTYYQKFNKYKNKRRDDL